jgi:histidinol phosphatase-like enzyme (inositol monophosphatase family)
MDYAKNFAPFFNELADEAGAIQLAHFRGPLPVDEKQDRSPVTTADRAIEEKLRAHILKAFPDHGIIGEEFGSERADAEFVWVIDPIDGTRAFMTGKPMFGTIIGLMHRNKPVVGLIEQAFTKERWFGIADTRTTHNGKPVKVAAPRKLDAARLYIGSPNMFDGPRLDEYLTLCRAARWPQYGCDCYAYGLLAMGWADLVVEMRLKIHDVAGIVPIITGAGGVALDWSGKPISGDAYDGTMVAASTRELADEARKIMA